MALLALILVFINMCIAPILIKNPNHGRFVRGSSLVTDVTSQYIPVPCGKCFECSTKKTLQFAQRCYFMSKDYYFYFGMLSYKNGMFSSFTLNGNDYFYASYQDVKNMIKRLRNDNAFGRDFKYVFVREYGGKKHRLHWHFLLALKKYSTDSVLFGYSFEKKIYDTILLYWSRNVGSRRSPIYVPLLEFHQVFRNGVLYSNYSCHFVQSRGLTEDRVYFYLVKYLFKHDKYSEFLQVRLREDCSSLGVKFISYWNLIRPMYVASKGFGVDEDLSIKNLFDVNSKIIPFVQVGNSLQPVSGYYKRKYMSFEQKKLIMQDYKDDNGNIVFYDNRSKRDRDIQVSSQNFYDNLISYENDCFDFNDFL